MANSGSTEAPLLIEEFSGHRYRQSFVHPSHGTLTSTHARSINLATALGVCGMLFYVQMRWNIEGRLSFDEMWDYQVREQEEVAGKVNVVHMYKVAGQRRVIALLEAESADELDRIFMATLPLREYLDIEIIWALREFSSFVEDCKRNFRE
ncbi:muconolactone Delta-isomerase [Streptomyces sp. NPDC101237]|uniref:muconolactone Delta-isomerase n=1 Tax=Streptomyces sp. NPDC101237 TaxID=3366139 RepID=UPI0037F4873D